MAHTYEYLVTCWLNWYWYLYKWPMGLNVRIQQVGAVEYHDTLCRSENSSQYPLKGGLQRLQEVWVACRLLNWHFTTECSIGPHVEETRSSYLVHLEYTGWDQDLFKLAASSILAILHPHLQNDERYLSSSGTPAICQEKLIATHNLEAGTQS